MKEDSTDLQTLFYSKDIKAIEKRLVQLEKDHQLEKMLETLLMMCKKVKTNYALDASMIPFIRKFFSTLPSTRAKSIADELIDVCDAAHSLLYVFSLNNWSKQAR
uniref:Uncharacterized protein n=1 Tax=Panagrolaimus davidi TaxID=227884 RepID=A0A914PT15_9BILA